MLAFLVPSISSETFLSSLRAVHVDMLDAMSRIYDIEASPPRLFYADDLEPEAVPAY